MKINKEQIEILEEKAKEVDITGQELLDMMIDFFSSMPKQDMKFFVSDFSGEYIDKDLENSSKENSCCGGKCH